jgi:ATP/maltotriose-dependent transcriptional regulator MalT
MALYYLEVWQPQGREVVVLEAPRVSMGKARSNDVVLPSDPTVSRMHAVLERFAGGWCVRDLAARNGTFVNGQRLLGDRQLRSGDEIRLGATRLVFRAEGLDPDETETQAAKSAPALTPRECDVLVALCLPLVSGDLFTEPAPIRQIADTLVVTEAAVKQHLLHLYDKFGIYSGTGSRRVRLANEAIRRGAVSVGELLVAASREALLKGPDKS